jgi:death-on-curing protein
MENYAEEVAHLLVDVYELHEVVLAEGGGLPGLREALLLHAAVARPFASFGGDELYPTDFEKAAALFHSLVKSHPFLDGTKRTAFLSAIFFLKSRGHTIPPQVPLTEVVEFCVSLAEENLRQGWGEDVTPLTIPEIAEWFRRLLGAGEPASNETDEFDEQSDNR